MILVLFYWMGWEWSKNNNFLGLSKWNNGNLWKMISSRRVCMLQASISGGIFQTQCGPELEPPVWFFLGEGVHLWFSMCPAGTGSATRWAFCQGELNRFLIIIEGDQSPFILLYISSLLLFLSSYFTFPYFLPAFFYVSLSYEKSKTQSFNYTNKMNHSNPDNQVK